MLLESGPRLGMVGGGQLARMSAAPASALGIEFWVLAAHADESAAQVVQHVMLGSHENVEDLRDFAASVDVMTFDHEHVPPDHLRQLQAMGVAVRPGPDALIFAQDKLRMRQMLTEAGLRCPSWAQVWSAADVEHFAQSNGWPVVLKTSRGGYDGKGVWVIEHLDQVQQVLETSLPPDAVWLVEAHVRFTRELCAQVARSPHGQAVAYPVVQTMQRDGVCAEVISPAPDLDPERAVSAQAMALHIADLLDVTGMLAVEMFDDGEHLYVNELAMRPHNSGHWSIDGSVTSQFENHLRAVLDLPLGSPRALAPYAVMVNILGGDVGDLYSAYRHVLARDPGIKVHLYGKAVRPGRKVGHVTCIGDDLPSLLERARHAADYFSGTIDH